MSSPVCFENLTLQPANSAQRLEVIKYVSDQWGSPEMGLGPILEYHNMIETQEYAKGGKLVYWVLVPQHDVDTLNFYSCCRTYRRDTIVLHAGSNAPTKEAGYVVSAVVTPPKHRGHRYALRMMSLLHYALAPHVYPNPGVKINIPRSVHPATLSVLYSAVGNYYARCGPTPREAGWEITKPISTTWDLSETIQRLDENPSSLAPVHNLSFDEVQSLLASDVPDLKAMTRLPKKTYFAFAPTSEAVLYLMTQSACHPLHKQSSKISWGARTVTGDNWITWSFGYDSPHTLQINRLKADKSSLPGLLMAALRAGAAQGSQRVEAWNVPQELIPVAKSTGGTTEERTTYLPAVKWYGTTQTQDVEWLMNEHYSFM